MLSILTLWYIQGIAVGFLVGNPAFERASRALWRLINRYTIRYNPSNGSDRGTTIRSVNAYPVIRHT